MRKVIIMCLLLFICVTHSYAHRINVFCYVEKTKIKCYSKFSTGSKVKKGSYKVYANDKLLFEGYGDDNGNFFYEIPKDLLDNPQDIKIECIAEMGHKNYWIIKKYEYSNISKQNEKIDQSSFNEDDLFQDNDNKNTNHNYTETNINIKDLENIIERIISREIAPIKMDISEMKEHKTDIRDILGGIGYILGIMGIILYFKSKSS